MGTLSFAKILKYRCLAAIDLGAAIAAIAALSSPAATQAPSEGSQSKLKSWDTDNLAYGGYQAKHHRIPYHNYSGYTQRVDAIPCMGYNVQVNGNLLSGHLRPQDSNTGSCPDGYSRVTHTCLYRYRVLTSVSPVTRQDIYHYRPVLSSGSCEPLTKANLACGKVNGIDSCTATSWPLRGSKNRISSSLGLCQDSYRRYYLAVYCGNYLLHWYWLWHEACQSAIADTFFQTGGRKGAVNDFPLAEFDEENQIWRVTATGSRIRGCGDFAKQQERLQASVAATGHYLAEEGGVIALKSSSADLLASRVVSVRPAAAYGSWRAKGEGYGAVRGRRWNGIGWKWDSWNSFPVSSSSAYNARVDTRAGLAMADGISKALVYPWNVAAGAGLGAKTGMQSCSSLPGAGSSASCWYTSDGVNWSRSSPGSFFAEFAWMGKRSIASFVVTIHPLKLKYSNWKR